MNKNEIKALIVILGGMGPDASARLYQSMIQIARNNYKATENHQYPDMVIYNIPVKDFIDDYTHIEESLHYLKQKIKAINHTNTSVIGIACNTVHLLLPEFLHLPLPTS